MERRGCGRGVTWLAGAVLTLTSGSAFGQALAFSTYIGGDGQDTARDVALDAEGNFYATGGSKQNFPSTDGTTNDPGGNGASFGGHDVWVAKWSPTGSLSWATLIGGDGYDRAYAIEVDATGVYVAGRAGVNFPTTGGAVQTSFAGDGAINPGYGPQDGFVVKLDLDGNILWSTYLGDASGSFIRDIDIDSSGSVHAAMTYLKSDLPHVTSGAYQTQRNGAECGAVVKIAPDGSSVDWGTYLCGSSASIGLGNPSIRVASNGDVFVTGYTEHADYPTTPGAFQTSRSGSMDLVLTGLAAGGSSLLFSTYLGGSGGEAHETHSLALAPDRLYVTGGGDSTNYPSTAGTINEQSPGGSNILLSAFSFGGQLIASTYIGGMDAEHGEGIAVLPSGDVVISGRSESSDFPSTTTLLQGQGRDGHIVVIDADLETLLYAARVGGNDTSSEEARCVAIHPSSYRVVVGGQTASSDFPVTDASMHSGDLDGTVAIMDFAAFAPPPDDSDPDDPGDPNDPNDGDSGGAANEGAGCGCVASSRSHTLYPGLLLLGFWWNRRGSGAGGRRVRDRGLQTPASAPVPSPHQSASP